MQDGDGWCDLPRFGDEEKNETVDSSVTKPPIIGSTNLRAVYSHARSHYHPSQVFQGVDVGVNQLPFCCSINEPQCWSNANTIVIRHL